MLRKHTCKYPLAERFYQIFAIRILGCKVVKCAQDSANSEIITFGQDIFGGDHVQFTIPGNTLMGGRLKPDAAVKDAVGFALMGTTVSPGFDFADLEMGTFNDLAAQYPDRKELIKALS